jgi:acetylglutamate kinase
MNLENQIKKAEILIEALPYIQKLYGKTVVIKPPVQAAVSRALSPSPIDWRDSCAVQSLFVS